MLQSRVFWTLAVLVSLSILLGIGFVAYREVSLLADSSARVEGAYHALEVLDDLESGITEAETGQRGFLLTQDASYLDTYRQAVAKLPATLAEMNAIGEREPRLASDTGRLEELTAQKLQQLRLTIEQAEHGERRAALARENQGDGQRTMTEFRRVATSLSVKLRGLLETRRVEEKHARLVSQGLLAAAILLGGLLFGGAALVSRRFDQRNRLLAREVMERAAAQAALARLSAAIESANDAVVITDADLEAPGPRIQYVNAAFTEMTGYSSEEVIGKSPRFLQGPGTDRAELRRLREELPARQIFHGEAINYRKDGSEFVVEWRISPIRDAQGTVVSWVAIQRDATDRKRTEEYREALLSSERTARSQAERATRLKDEFVATLSHELRTPLNAIVGWASILRRDPRPQTVTQGMEVIERNAKIQAQMVEDLLDMSRILSGKMRVDLQKMDLPGVLDAAIGSVRPAAEAKQVRIETMLGSAGPINGDPGRIQQVVWNLLANAVKFTPRGGKVQVSLRKTGSQVEIAVSDTGQGIRQEFLPFVFDRFRQADASTTRRFGGLGLGLSIVKSLVEMHGGSVEVHSPGEGLGTTFIVRLPLALAHRHVEEAGGLERADDEMPSLAELRVLVVDDEADARALARRVLEDAGAEVATAGSVEEALASFSKARPHVLVSDLGMPERDGYDLIREVRALMGEETRVHAVALSALARVEDRRRALLAGYHTHVPKPVDPAELVAVIASLTGRTGQNPQAAAGSFR